MIRPARQQDTKVYMSSKPTPYDGSYTYEDQRRVIFPGLRAVELSKACYIVPLSKMLFTIVLALEGVKQQRGRVSLRQLNLNIARLGETALMSTYLAIRHIRLGTYSFPTPESKHTAKTQPDMAPMFLEKSTDISMRWNTRPSLSSQERASRILPVCAPPPQASRPQPNLSVVAQDSTAPSPPDQTRQATSRHVPGTAPAAVEAERGRRGGQGESRWHVSPTCSKGRPQ